MTNALNELREIAKGLTIKAAQITHSAGWSEDSQHYELSEGATEKEVEIFERNLGYVSYDSGYGTQYLFGVVWFTDGTWAERHEYDGSENWVRKQCPPIPHHLRAKSKNNFEV